MSPFVRKAYRQRGIRRERIRPNAAGNFVTSYRQNKVWFIAFPRTEAHYINWDGYIPPYTRAVGYFYPPPPPHPWQLLQAITSPNAYNDISGVPEPFNPVPPPTAPGLPYPPTAPGIPLPPGISPPLPPISFPSPPVVPPISPPPGLPPGAAGIVQTIPVPAPDFMANNLDVSGSPIKVSTNPVKARSILLFAHPNNTSDIRFWSIRHPVIHGLLPPGLGIVLEIDDPSKIVVQAVSGTQKLVVAWEIADYSGLAGQAGGA
jgi:hypothetical protein